MKLTSRQKSLLHRIATATRVNYGDSSRTAGSLIRLGLVAKASGEALRLTPQGKAEFYAPTEAEKASATMNLTDLSYVRSVLAGRVAASVADGDLAAPAGAKCRTRSGFRAWLRRAEKQLKKALGMELIAHNGEPLGSTDRIELWNQPGHGKFIKWGDGATLTEDRIGFAEAAEYCTERRVDLETKASATITKLHYFQSEVEPKVGDEISIGKNGRCRVEAIVGGELQARNIHTGELFTVFADDCDLLGRAELDDQASVVVAKLLAAGRGREANSLGRIVGAWRKGHVGDCALRNAITGSERRLAETGTPAVEHVTQDAAAGEAANKRDGNPEGNEDYHLAGGGEKIVCTTDEREAYEDATGVEIESDVLARDIFFEFLTWLQSNFEMEQAADKMPSPEPYVN